jgi:PhzF family phenazine biosynthesis protein
MPIPYYEIHSFAEPGKPFSGNPAGVCLLEVWPDDAALLGIANSNNLSETAFLIPKGEDLWDLRWLTPEVEVDLCGHATFAAGAVAFGLGLVKGEAARFDSRSGRLEVARTGTDHVYAMDLPQIGFQPAQARQALREALGFDGAEREVFSIDRIHGSDYEMWVLESEKQVAEAQPDFGAMKAVDANIILTAPGDQTDFVSRFFAPASGVPEDPVTGSAHCTLAPYWADRLGRKRLSARQIGPRPGALEVEDRGERIGLYGIAPRYLAGEIFL